jgi:hypothetical protein
MVFSGRLVDWFVGFGIWLLAQPVCSVPLLLLFLVDLQSLLGFAFSFWLFAQAVLSTQALAVFRESIVEVR